MRYEVVTEKRMRVAEFFCGTAILGSEFFRRGCDVCLHDHGKVGRDRISANSDRISANFTRDGGRFPPPTSQGKLVPNSHKKHHRNFIPDKKEFKDKRLPQARRDRGLHNISASCTHIGRRALFCCRSGATSRRTLRSSSGISMSTRRGRYIALTSAPTSTGEPG